jgi:GNAT superfamily N-acetyltransferase
MKDHSSSHLPFLALRNEAAVAMAWLALVDRVPGPEYFLRRSAYVQSVIVVSHERVNGIGTTLMGALLAHARNLGLDYVAVHPSERSFSLYRRLGFSDTDRVLELRS